MTYCPTEEFLAAFVEDKLDAPSRKEVTEHIADCGDCREQVLLAADFRKSEGESNVVPIGRWFAAAASLAAAAVIAIVVLRPAFVYGPSKDDVFAAIRASGERAGQARIAGLSFVKARPDYRGAAPPSSEVEFDPKLVEFYPLEGRIYDAKFPDPHVAGLVYLFTAKKFEEFDAAVKLLEKAHARERGEERDAVAVDLAGALLKRGQYEPEEAAKADATRALTLATDVFQRRHTPEAGWNRALALEALERYAEAVAAWNEVLGVERDPDYRKEAEKNRGEAAELVQLFKR